MRYLRNNATLDAHARKLLSFTDNRQDASLQAGHFNDFVQVSLLRSALFNAVADAGAAGVSYDTLPQAVFDALGLLMDEYAANPAAASPGILWVDCMPPDVPRAPDPFKRPRK